MTDPRITAATKTEIKELTFWYCKRCDRDLPISSFYKPRKETHHPNYCCRECNNKRIADLKRINPEYKARQFELQRKLNLTEKYKQMRREYARKYKDKRKKESEARLLAYKHVKIYENCYFCDASTNLIRHHHNYDRPLDVTILCQSCHRKHHRLLTLYQNSKQDK